MAQNIPKPATILERCRIAPPATAGTAEQTLSLTFFDMTWLHFHPVQRLHFYQFLCSTTHFLGTIVPNLKSSLSQTLKHFLPLAGNLMYPLDVDSSKPEFRYVPGDSVSVTIAESNEASDIDYLTGNQPRDANEFYAFVPDLPKSKNVGSEHKGFKSIPLFAVQITLFPGSGICLGFNNLHVIGDASSIIGFTEAWSSITKLGGDDALLSSTNLLAIYDRSLIKDPYGAKDIFWNQMKMSKVESSSPLDNLPLNKVRATYILKTGDIQKLRNVVQAKNQALVHLSPFTIATAYVWTCLAKTTEKCGEAVDDEEPECFSFPVDARPYMDPAAPATYFGNCVAPATVETTHGKLKGEEGFMMAVELIGEIIRTKVKNKEEILKGAERWMEKFSEMAGKRTFGVSGSPKFDVYETDFGWGKPKKYETLGIDAEGLTMSLNRSREFEGGLEIGMSQPVKKMEAFAAIFTAGLNL